MRIATYNVEWFANLFDKTDALLLDDEWSGRDDVRRAEQIEAIAKVLVAINADLVLIVEAPNSGRAQSSGRALEGFARTFDLRCKKALEGFANTTHQELTILYDPFVCDLHHAPVGTASGPGKDPADTRFDATLRLDLDIDGVADSVVFSKPPIEAAVTHLASDTEFRLIGVHVKSKAPHGARKLSEQIRISIENRRKQMAQCIWLRARVDHHLDQGDNVIVLGDMNDGPGLDEYENLFGHSGVEVVMGCDKPAERQLSDPNATEAMAQKFGHRPASSRFYIHDQRRYLNALLDYIMVSPSLLGAAERWQIWHPFDNPTCYSDPELRDALLTASDHFPVTLDLDL